MQRGGQIAAHQFVLGTNECLRTARIALTSAASKQLAIDAARFVTFGGDHMQPAQGSDTMTELNVGPTSSHVRRDGNVGTLSGQSHDGSFFVETHGIQNAELESALLQDRGEALTGGNAARADEQRAASGLKTQGFFDDR